MPVDSAALLKGLKPILKALDADLLKRAKDPGVEAAMRVSWKQEREASRTGDAFGTWQRRRCHQVSIAWILSVVFVRTLEDRGLIAHARIAGKGAADSEAQFFSLAPYLTARDYLLFVFRELASLPGAEGLFDARHNPVWVLAPSDGGAKLLLDFFRRPDKKGKAPPEFDGEDTRFLGDLYQNISEDVRKRYALLQTPEFVEEFILEQTLDPAVREFGLDEIRLIDPTCGSGHFLLGAFRRLLDAWMGRAPGEDRQVLAQRALGQVYGCDLNPYAVAIARFRLTLDFLHAAGIDRLERAPRLPLNLCVADSLLHGVVGEQQRLGGVVDSNARDPWGEQLFALEDEDEALRILGQRYHAVVGNPPYITEKDAKKRDRYRELYVSAAGKFALAAPFTERFFGLAVQAGFVGMINANSFTKRGFGRALIEQVLPELDVNQVIDTSGTYIPGHGTPTLLLFGRNREAAVNAITAVMGKRGEAEEPDEPANAPVWSEITRHHQDLGFDGRYVSVESIPRDVLAKHPWTLAGGGASEIKRALEDAASSTLGDYVDSIGFSAFSGEDGVFLQPKGSFQRLGVAATLIRPLYRGEDIREWAASQRYEALCPYDLITHEAIDPPPTSGRSYFYLWQYKKILSSTKYFAGKIKTDVGMKWWEWYRWVPGRFRGSNPIVFSYTSTHNHFVHGDTSSVYRGGASVGVIKFRSDTAEDDILSLLGLLNSSVVALWCRFVMFLKGGDQVGDGARVSPSPWDRHLEYAGNLLKQLPVPSLADLRSDLLHLVRRAEEVVETMREIEPYKALEREILNGKVTYETLVIHRRFTMSELERLRGVLVSIQEELDWRVYGIFGLPTVLSDNCEDVLVPVAPEHRPMEVRLARELDNDLSARIWFDRHKRTPPADVGGPLVDLYRRRLELTEKHKELKLLEIPETKRRWSPRDYEAEFKEAYRSWLLDCTESLLKSQQQPNVTSVRQLAAEIGRDPRVGAVAEVYTGESAPDLERLVSDLVKAEGVPYLSTFRFSDTGLEKKAAWRETWDLQRREDAGEDVGNFPVPARYANKDYSRNKYWAHRGKLDVPKERFILYPGTETENDTSPWIGWTGWDHLQRATALSGLYQQRKTNEGWGIDRLIPLLAGLHELVPWLIQWHNDPDPHFGGQRLGDFFRDFVGGEVQRLGLPLGDLEDWRPTAKTTARMSTASTTSNRGRTPSLTPETLLAAVERLQGDGDVDLAQLTTDLGVSKPTVSKVAKACVETGQLEQTSGRPLRFRRA